MDSDVLGYEPDFPPRYWIRVANKGLHIRLRWFGLSFHFGAGKYSRGVSWGPFKAVLYRVDEYQTWLESWCGY